MSDFDEESVRAYLRATFERFAPRIPTEALPEAEREHAISVDLLLGMLSSLVESFRTALALYDHVQKTCPDLLQRSQWQIMAASDAVMTVWSFGETLRALETAYKSSPTLVKMLGGKQALKPVRGNFGAHFSSPAVGDIEGTRNANSHLIERLETAEARRLNSLPSGTFGYRNLFVRSGIATIEFSHKRRLHKLEFSRASLAKLEEIRTSVLSLFRPLSATLIQETRKPKDASPPDGA